MSRAQSTVLGTIMLVAVVVVTVTVFGAFAIASLADSNEGPVLDLSGTVTASDLTLAHEGGDPLDASSLVVYLRYDGSEAVHSFSDGAIAGDGDDRFEAGERWTVAHGIPIAGDERIRVLVVDESSGTVLLDAARSVE